MIDFTKWEWTREPASCVIKDGRIEVVTKPHTDLWQRTYYHFRNDNAPVFQMGTDEKFFSFTVKTEFESAHHRFDQCGVVLYLDSENWLKGSIEYENDRFQHLGSVVVCQMWEAAGPVRFGVYACSPEDSSFQAVFTHMELGACQWLAHDGQQPDEDA